MKELSNLIITKIYSVTKMYNEKGAAAKRENRPCWALVLKYEGETVYRQADREIVSNSLNTILLPKGCDYHWGCTESGSYISVEFESILEGNDIFAFNIKNTEKILNILKGIESKLLLKKDLYEIECIKDLYSVILRLNEQSRATYIPSKKRLALNEVMNYIAENYTKEIRNEDLAALTGYSVVYFRKLFKEAYGTSPIDYVKELRIKKAKEMLRSDYGSITDIAFSLGYLNIYDFSRDFKKRVGVSPKNFEK